MTLSHLVTLFNSSLHNLDIEANKSYDKAHELYDAALLKRCYIQPCIALEVFILSILSKLNLSTKMIDT